MASVAACSSDDDTSESAPFTVIATVNATLDGIDNLIATSADCEHIRTENGDWNSSTPVVFRQDDREIGSAPVDTTTNRDPETRSLARWCVYTITGQVAPVSDTKITAVLPDGAEWTLPIIEWENRPSQNITGSVSS